MFAGSVEQLRGLYENKGRVQAAIAQRNLWLQQLRAGGNAPAEDVDELFVRHTLLILIARLIARTVRSDGDAATAGFVQWVPEDGDFVKDLAGIISRYDWGHRSVDVLRGLYGRYVESRHRRSFGEHYTPDWLAERICTKVIDDRYIGEQLANFGRGAAIKGVLDPFCGSGTFLVHAVRRILNSRALAKEAGLSDRRKNDFASRMVCGMDIHPVAVEMSRCNMRRLLPTVPASAIRVHQGDSMLVTTRSDGSVSSDGDKAGRIVSNPPWVALQEIRHRPRRDEVERAARDEGLFVGGTVAGRFDVAMLAVRRAICLYMDQNGRKRSGFVLPQGAMLGAGNWKRFAGMYGRMATDQWDVGRLPFPNTPSCVLLMEDGTASKRPSKKTYRMRKGMRRVKPQESWAEASSKIQAVDRPEFPKKAAEYAGRHGASLQPMSLVRIKTKEAAGGSVQFTTYSSFKTPWKTLGSRSGEVPASFVKDTLISAGMLPFHARLGSNIIPMLDEGQWDPGRDGNAYWRTSQSLYAGHRGHGRGTPATLEERLDHMGELVRQFVGKSHRVAYNSVGDYLYAAAIPRHVICGVGIVYVDTSSGREAQFLSALLNADCLHDAFVSAQRTDRNFHMHILNDVPLPRFSASNPAHRAVVRTSAKCEKIARQTCDAHSADLGAFKMRAAIRAELRASGLQQELAESITKILPEHSDA